VANIYDLGERIYIIKFSLPTEGKRYLLLEPGRRIHTTQFSREKNAVPSQLSMNLRKHLRTRKLIAIKQLGVDRVVDFVFRTGETECHLLVELYASGNLILTDGNYTILALLRIHKFDEKVKCAVKEKYPFAQAAHLTIEDFAKLKLTEENLGEEYKKALEQRGNEGEEDKKGKKKKKGKFPNNH